MNTWLHHSLPCLHWIPEFHVLRSRQHEFNFQTDTAAANIALPSRYLDYCHFSAATNISSMYILAFFFFCCTEVFILLTIYVVTNLWDQIICFCLLVIKDFKVVALICTPTSNDKRPSYSKLQLIHFVKISALFILISLLTVKWDPMG